MEEQNLKQKTIKGVGWSAIDNVSGYAVSFFVGIILARLLSPEDYGLLGLIGIFTAICNCFIGAGFGSALIRKKMPQRMIIVLFSSVTLAWHYYFIAFSMSAPHS